MPVTKEEFQGEWTARAPNLLLNLRVQTGVKTCGGPLCLFHGSLLEWSGRPAPKHWTAAPLLQLLNGEEQPLSDLKLFFHTLFIF